MTSDQLTPEQRQTCAPALTAGPDLIVAVCTQRLMAGPGQGFDYFSAPLAAALAS